MTKEGYKTVIVQKNAYDLANHQAKLEETSIAEIVSKAIERYVNARKDLEERARLLIKLLDEERKSQVSV